MSKTLFGIKACDTMKKARTWLDEHGVSYAFHDYKACGIERGNLEKWCNEHGWETTADSDRFTVRDGIAVIPKDAIVPDGWIPEPGLIKPATA